MNPQRSQRRTALVTGASYGIGAAIAQVLARDSYDVAVTELNADTLADTPQRIQAQGARGVPVALDTRSQHSVEACMTTVLDAFVHLDLLVNNAGVLLHRSRELNLNSNDAVTPADRSERSWCCARPHRICATRPAQAGR